MTSKALLAAPLALLVTEGCNWSDATQEDALKQVEAITGTIRVGCEDILNDPKANVEFDEKTGIASLDDKLRTVFRAVNEAGNSCRYIEHANFTTAEGRTFPSRWVLTFSQNDIEYTLSDWMSEVTITKEPELGNDLEIKLNKRYSPTLTYHPEGKWASYFRLEEAAMDSAQSNVSAVETDIFAKAVSRKYVTKQ